MSCHFQKHISYFNIGTIRYRSIITAIISMYKYLIITTLHVMQIPVEQKVEISKGIAAGLGYMYHHNPVIIHRDLKPLNIMV